MEALKYKGTLHCARTIIREEGAGAVERRRSDHRSKWNQSVSLFTAKAHVDSFLWGKNDGDSKVLHPAQSLVSGGLAATIGPIATGPFDVAKTRLMAQSKAGGKAPSTNPSCTRSRSFAGKRASWPCGKDCSRASCAFLRDKPSRFASQTR